MMLTNEIVRLLVKEHIGAGLAESEIERLRSLIEQQLERMRELHELDLGGGDPRAIHYVNDPRLVP
ncbi:MAG: hypothetical protein GEU73_08445 [Chloroflexi bacterium]|nr:hypothetical protein [Chloroflexota bacterium]